MEPGRYDTWGKLKREKREDDTHGALENKRAYEEEKELVKWGKKKATPEAGEE